jgi:phosphoserine phosphatase
VIAFKSVVLDVDSTVSAIEGIDWLAALRGGDVTKLVESLTNDAMEERVPLDEVYERRLALIRPTRAELRDLSAVYITAALPGVRDAVRVWKNAGVHVVLVSGGLRDAILPLANWLGIPDVDVHAVDVLFNGDNAVTGVVLGSPLARRGGKPLVVEALTLQRPLLAVGDGATDADLTVVADRFIAFTGVVRRAAVVARAHSEVDSFAALTPIVLGL